MSAADEKSWAQPNLNTRLIPTASVPVYFAAMLESLKVPVRTEARVSGVVQHYGHIVSEAHGAYAWFVPLVCEEFYEQWAKQNMEGITYVTMCSLAAEAYAAEKEAERGRARQDLDEAKSGPGEYLVYLSKRQTR